MSYRITASAAIAALLAGAAAASEIGSVAAVNRDIDGTPPGATTRALLLGDRLIANERLVSSPDGSGQMLFLDQTTLTVSPNSEIVLDKYVYDPATQTGEIGVTMTRGVLRMIGGRITKNTDAVVKTPTATIGIRGGISLVVVENDQTTRVMHVAGEYTRVESGGETLTLSRTNALATVQGDGAPVYDGVATDQDVAALYDQTQGGGGGTSEEVTPQTADASTVANVNSEEPNASTAPPISTSGESPA
ncbi:MAG: FecR domain-containing protein, partial [Pseudomonadota bacterium]